VTLSTSTERIRYDTASNATVLMSQAISRCMTYPFYLRY
jgi:hypothetical protein